MGSDGSASRHAMLGQETGVPGSIGQTSRWTLHTFGTTLLATAGSVGIAVITARALGPDDKGAYDLVLATAALFVSLVGLSLQAGITYVVARGLGDVDRLLPWVVGIIVAQTALIAVVTWGVDHTPLARAFFPPSSSTATRTAVVLIAAFSLIQNAARGVMIGRREITQANLFELTGRSAHLGLFVLGILALAWLGEEPTPGHFIWMAVLATGFACGLYVSGVRPTARGDRGSSGIGQVVRFSLVAHAANVMQFLNYRLDTFFIGYFSGVGAVGIYTLSATLAQLLWLLPQSAAAVMVPVVASADESGVDSAPVAAGVSRGVVAVCTVAAITMALSGPVVVPLVFGNAFSAGLEPLYLLLPGVIAFAPCVVLAGFFSGLGRPDVNLRASLAGLIATVTLDLALIPSFGIRGAAIAKTVSYTVSAAVLVVGFSRMTGLAPGTFLIPRRRDAATLIGAMVRPRGNR